MIFVLSLDLQTSQISVDEEYRLSLRGQRGTSEYIRPNTLTAARYEAALAAEPAYNPYLEEYG